MAHLLETRLDAEILRLNGLIRDLLRENEVYRTALEWITEHHDVQAMLTKAREALRANM